MTKFGDIDAAKAKASINAEIKAILMLLFQMFSGARQNTADKIHNFIPHLKRTDRDCGSLPFYSTTFTSHKTNKEHVLLCMLSMVVQTYWDIVDDTKEVAVETIDEFSDVMQVLEEMSKGTFDDYRVYGPVMKFTLLSKKCIDAIEVEEAKKELAEAEHKEEREQKAREDEAEGKKLMAAELGSDDSTSQDSDSTDAAEVEEVPPVNLIGLVGAAGRDTQQEGSSEASSSDQQVVIGSEAGQVSVEDADNCGGDCDDCDNPGCQTNQTDADPDEDEGVPDQSDVDAEHQAEREDNLEGAEVGGDSLGRLPADSESGGEADSEAYPDVEPLEKTITDAKEVIENVPGSLADENGGETPPMPEEDKEADTAPVDETGDDSADDDGDSQEAVVS